MGSKFANVQVFCGDVERVQARCPRHTALRLADGWVTVVSESIEWGSAQKVARDLSKQLPYAVMSVEYFDDDFVEFAVYTGGTRAARHRPTSYESYERKAGKSKDFAQIFGLGDGAEATLRKIFRETDAEESVHLLEALLGCVLWVDCDTLEYAKQTPPEYADEYFARKAEEKERAKIKNRTKLVLLDEISGEVGWTEGMRSYPIVFSGGEGMKSLWRVSPEGRFEKVLEVLLPGLEGWMRDCTDAVSYIEIVRLPDGKEWLAETTGYIFENDGTLIDTIPITERSVMKFLDDDRIFGRERCCNFRTRKVEWGSGARHRWDFVTPCMVTGDRVAFVNENFDIIERGDGTEWRLRSYSLVTVDIDGGGRREVEEVASYRWDCPLTHDGRIYMMFGDRLVCYDEQLNELWSASMPATRYRYRGVIDGENGRLYMVDGGNVIAFDTEARQVTATLDCGKTFRYLQGVLPGVGPVMLSGDSTIEVFDAELNLISRHRAKGEVIRQLQLGGRSFLVTLMKPPGGRTMTARLYELK